MNEAATKRTFVDPQILDRIRVGREYVSAKYGFRNHWYPVLFSHEIAEGEARPVELLGEKILLRRIDGRIFGVRDRCLHRGVALSRKLQCFTKHTVSCWYHGFTYRFDTGLLCDIVGTDKSSVIGKRRLRTYPAQEAKGLVFVFVGDEGKVAPLAEDVPPDFLDADLAIRGMRREVNANWRIGAENGFDSTHIFIHRDSVLIKDNDLALPLGLIPDGHASFQTVEAPGGPKGVYDLFGRGQVRPVFVGTIEGEEVLRGHPEGKNHLPETISIWLPGVLRVHPWPDPSLTQFEWYVPIDGKRHIYLQTLGRRVASAVEEETFEREFESRWRPVALQGFNDDDAWAREATEPFYADDTGWLKEQLFEPDANIVAWRRLASRLNRGVQLPEHIA